MAKSTYEYERRCLDRPEDPDDVRISARIRAIWLKSSRRYGYRKIALALRAAGERVNHKRVLRTMLRMGISAELAGHGKGYSSYRGSVGRTAPNLMRRDFHADAFLRKCGTDVTEFALPSGKCYFSPVVDFSNGEILSYSLSERPDMAMVMSMLAGLFARFPRVSGMMLHSDQGWPYQMECYRRALRDHGVVQSMSRKGNCLDNAETENLFSVMKKEMFYGHEKEFRSFAEFRDRLDEYVVWYNTERIKQRIGGAPVFHRSMHPLPLLCYNTI
jgi:putative transposase